MNCLSYGLPGDLCKDVSHLQAFRDSMGDLACHPYNIENPELSVWWLFPKVRRAGNWPAYEYGKFIFDKPSGRGMIRTGIHVEKGLGKEVADLCTGANRKHYFMTRDWLWHSFLQDMEHGPLGQALDQIASSTHPDLVEIEVSSGPSPFEQGDSTQNVGRWRFGFEQSSHSLFLLNEWRRAESLAEVEAVGDLSQLAKRLRIGTDEEPMFWFNLVIGVALKAGVSEDSCAEGLWSAQDVWNAVLKPLSGWVRTG